MAENPDLAVDPPQIKRIRTGFISSLSALMNEDPPASSRILQQHPSLDNQRILEWLLKHPERYLC
jgi:hypothetical protein